MRSLLFDSSGRICHLEAVQFPEPASAQTCGRRLLDHAVRKLGFIAVDETKHLLRIKWLPAKASPVAFSALCYYLADRNPARIGISWLDGVWRYVVFGSLQSALRHLAAMLPATAHRAGDFLSEPLSLAAVQPSSAIGTLIRIWQDSGRALDIAQIEPLLACGLRNCYVIAETDAADVVYLHEVGHGFPWVDKRWAARARGLRMQDQPDYYFGKWAAAAYRKAAVTGEPSLEDVDAITARPGKERERIRYRRLILPIGPPGGRRRLLGAAAVDPAIDLRSGRPERKMAG